MKNLWLIKYGYGSRVHGEQKCKESQIHGYLKDMRNSGYTYFEISKLD